MVLKEISYSESRKLTTDKKYESKLISFSAKAEIAIGDDIAKETENLKEFVKKELQKELQ